MHFRKKIANLFYSVGNVFESATYLCLAEISIQEIPSTPNSSYQPILATSLLGKADIWRKTRYKYGEFQRPESLPMQFKVFSLRASYSERPPPIPPQNRK